MLLEGKSALTDSGRLKEIEISKDAPIIYLDFDKSIYGTIKNFEAPHGILFPVGINNSNLFHLTNFMIAVTKNNHPVLQNTVKTIKGYFSIEHKNYFDQLIKHLDDAFKINHLNDSDKRKILLKSFLYDLKHNDISNIAETYYLGAYYLRYILDWKKGAYIQKSSINNSDHLDLQLPSHMMQCFVYSITSGCLAEFLAEQKNKTKIQNQGNFWDYLYEDYTEKSNVIKSEKENVNIFSSISNLMDVPLVIGITDHIAQSWKGNTFDKMYKQEELTLQTNSNINFDMAIIGGDMDVVVKLLKEGVNVNAVNLYGNTALMFSAIHGRTEIAELLIREGANINAPNKDGYTPLTSAAYNGQTEIAELLIDRKATVDARSKNGNTPFIIAILQGHTEVAKLLIEEKADVNVRDNNGFQPIHAAAQNGKKETINLLLEYSINDINDAQNKGGIPPLFFAISNGHIEAVKLLIENGAYFNIKDKYGQTPLDLAHKNNQNEIISLLEATEELFDGVISKDFKRIEMAINSGTNVNAKNKNGDTALILSTINGSKDIVKFLLENGAKVNKKNKNNSTPLHLAISSNNIKITELLLKYGAKMNERNDNDEMPLHFAAQAGHAEVVKLLISKGADVSLKSNIMGNT
ncbi:ankyrin repeat domain-containing protein [Candidatus Mesenet endosymbiont of Agriotes lineatus]|uniref:ankyrin repeat domain-containing protein n=1 Tax=Candidatus Mesenet endosymbiont of Agriotes lineatus TaxID=3077948 RepID=UPI0030CBE553